MGIVVSHSSFAVWNRLEGVPFHTVGYSKNLGLPHLWGEVDTPRTESGPTTFSILISLSFSVCLLCFSMLYFIVSWKQLQKTNHCVVLLNSKTNWKSPDMSTGTMPGSCPSAWVEFVCVVDRFLVGGSGCGVHFDEIWDLYSKPELQNFKELRDLGVS